MRDLAIELRRQGKTFEEISAATGISKTTLCRLFKKLNITISARHPCFNKEWLDAHAGFTKREKAKIAEVDMSTIDYWMRVIGGKVKRVSQKIININLIQEEIWYNYDWLYEHYITQNLGLSTLSKMIGRSVGKINDALIFFGIPKRSLKASMARFAKRPTKEWIYAHYVQAGWSIDKCSAEFGCSWSVMYKAIMAYGFPDRSATEQFSGSLNPFYGRKHTEETKIVCAQMGAINGKLYWTSGDISAKMSAATAQAKQIWADPVRREEQSQRITELCKTGQCSSKKHSYIMKDGRYIYPNSSWELAIAELLDDLEIVESWAHEELSIPYQYEGIFHNFIVDFRVKWIDGIVTYIECKNERLLGLEKEQAKIAAANEFLQARQSGLIVVSNKKDVANCQARSRIDPGWIIGNRYSIPSSVVKESSAIILEILKHDITAQLISNWRPLQYTNNELSIDIDRVKTERLDLYCKDNQVVASPGGSMAGRLLTTHFQPHFYDVISNEQKTLASAFEDPWVIYRSLSQSISEGDGLTLERLLREIWFLFPGKYSRTSHFPTGLVRYCLHLVLGDLNNKILFDPCCGWGSRLLAAYAENMKYVGCELSTPTYKGLLDLNASLGYSAAISNIDCIHHQWPECDVVFTSPPFYDIEEYVGDDQPHQLATHNDWMAQFVIPFLSKLENRLGIFYLDQKTLADFTLVRKPTRVITVKNRRHPRQKMGYEYFAIYE